MPAVSMVTCCEESCMAPMLCPDALSGDERHHGRQLRSRVRRDAWVSPDPKLRFRGIRYLQIGGDTWNRCGPGWLNLDGNFDATQGSPGENKIFEDDTHRFNMRHVVRKSSRLPFRNESVQLVYSEHMLEHMLPLDGGVNILSEAWRVLAPGGLLRLVTPDLAKYVCALTGHGDPDFLAAQARRFAPLQTLSQPPSGATAVNNIFRNYGHEWIYDFDEIRRALGLAGVVPSYACRSDRSGRGLPRWARAVFRRANVPRYENQTCWIDQDVRERESVYVNVIKPAE